MRFQVGEGGGEARRGEAPAAAAPGPAAGFGGCAKAPPLAPPRELRAGRVCPSGAPPPASPEPHPSFSVLYAPLGPGAGSPHSRQSRNPQGLEEACWKAGCFPSGERGVPASLSVLLLLRSRDMSATLPLLREGFVSRTPQLSAAQERAARRACPGQRPGFEPRGDSRCGRAAGCLHVGSAWLTCLKARTHFGMV